MTSNLLDSRRLTGPNLLQFGPGAILDVELDGGGSGERVVSIWSRHVRAALEAVGWDEEQAASRIFKSGLSLAHTAPVDALYAATEVNEWAFEQTCRELAGEPTEPIAGAAPRLVALIEEERNPRVVELTQAAADRGLACLRDDDCLSLGLGCGSRTWGVGDLPSAETVNWSDLHDIPLALVTGTNGKSTTVRMLAAIVAAAGLTPGVSSTDRIEIGGRCLEKGDWAGPGGARRVLREAEVEVAILETARGGLLRRGLAVERAEVAVVTNVAADHLGEWGVADVEELADAKLVVSRAAQHLVLNADDPVLAARADSFERPVTWCSLRSDDPVTGAHLAKGARVVRLEDDRLVLHEGATQSTVTTIEDLPAALGGAVRFNVLNALGAIGAARQLGLSLEAMAAGLRRFRSSPEDNPGRLNLFERGGVRALVDFAHNPHGLQAMLAAAVAMKPERLLVVIGQAGDRDDDSIRQLAQVAAAARPDRVIVKEMKHYLRGRPEGEVASMLVEELLACGMSGDRLERVSGELDAARRAVDGSRSGDLLLFICHTRRGEVLSFFGDRFSSE